MIGTNGAGTILADSSEPTHARALVLGDAADAPVSANATAYTPFG
jgi:hypothetical protein